MSFDAAELALKAVCPSNKFLYDDKEMPSMFVYIPKFRLCDVLSTADTSTHPAFRVNGQEIEGFYFGKYQTHHYNGRAYSLPCEDPSANANLDTFLLNNIRYLDAIRNGARSRLLFLIDPRIKKFYGDYLNANSPEEKNRACAKVLNAYEERILWKIRAWKNCAAEDAQVFFHQFGRRKRIGCSVKNGSD